MGYCAQGPGHVIKITGTKERRQSHNAAGDLVEEEEEKNITSSPPSTPHPTAPHPKNGFLVFHRFSNGHVSRRQEGGQTGARCARLHVSSLCCGFLRDDLMPPGVRSLEATPRTGRWKSSDFQGSVIGAA